MNRRRTSFARTGVVAAVGLGLVAPIGLAACSGTPAGGDPSATTDKLDVISWWTSPSEKAALTVLYDAFRTANPGVQIADGAVVGGSGSNVQVVLASRLQQGNPPDVWQTFLGGSLKSLVGANRVEDVSSVLSDSGMAGQLPKGLLDALTVNGKQYGVPAGAHRQNVLWFNRVALAKGKVKAPGLGYDADAAYDAPAFAADLAALDKAGVTPLCLGGKDRFTKVELFENVLLSQVGSGSDGWSAIAADRFDWRGPTVRAALAAFGGLLDRADPGADALTWDQAVGKLAKGECAFLSMNDSAYGELRRAGVVGGTDDAVRAVPYPGTQASYLSVIDTFVLAKGAKNPRNGRLFLTALADAGNQTAFSREKGSVPVRSDADLAPLSPYQRHAATALRSGQVLLSVTHGELVSPRLQQGFYDAVAAYAAGRDAEAFNRALVDAVSPGVPGGR